MPSPLERLDQAYADVMTASNSAFFRCLLAYRSLLREDPPIHRALGQARAQFEAALEQYKNEDAEFTRELVACRKSLVARAPEVDDSRVPKPALRPFENPDLKTYEEDERKWGLTLANFDAIATMTDDRIIERSWLDNRASRMLCEILNDKVFDLRHVPDKHGCPVRPDLEELEQEIGSIRDRQKSSYQRWVDSAEQTGYLAWIQVEIVAWYVEGPEGAAPDATDDLRGFIERILEETRGRLSSLRFAARSDLGGWLLIDDRRKELIEKHESACRGALEALQPRVRKRVGGSRQPRRWWIRLSQSNRIALVVGWGVIAVGIVTLVATL